MLSTRNSNHSVSQSVIRSVSRSVSRDGRSVRRLVGRSVSQSLSTPHRSIASPRSRRSQLFFFNYCLHLCPGLSHNFIFLLSLLLQLSSRFSYATLLLGVPIHGFSVWQNTLRCCMSGPFPFADLNSHCIWLYLLRPSSFEINLYQKIFKIFVRHLFINIWRTIVTLFVTFLVSDARHICKIIRRKNNNYFISIKFFLAIYKRSQNLIPTYFGWNLSPCFGAIYKPVYVKHLKHSAYNVYNYINIQNSWIFIPMCKPVKVFHVIQLD